MENSEAESAQAPPKKVATKRKRPAKKATKAAKPSGDAAKHAKRPYPRATLEDVLKIPRVPKGKNGGNPWPPADVAAAVGLSPKTMNFFHMAAASRDFGFTEGGRDSGLISLADFGRDVVYAPSRSDEDAKIKEAFLKVDIFRKVLDYYKGSNFPEMQYLRNTLVREFQLDTEFHEEFSRLFRDGSLGSAAMV